MKTALLYAISFASLLLTAGLAHAQGVVIDPAGRPVALELRRHHVAADVQEQVAVVTVAHEFFNPGRSTVEGTFLFPLPPEAQVSRFSMDVNGQELTGELLSADEARQIYEEIVRKTLDPALLEMADYRTFRARVFPIPPGETRKLTLRYDATLTREGQTVTFRYPMQGTLTWRGVGMPPPPPMPRPRQEGPRREHGEIPSQQSLMEFTINSATGVQNVYSPSHEVEIDRPNNRRASVSFEATNALDGRDFVLYYTLSDSDVGATLLTHRPYGDRPGYFMLLIDPPVEMDEAQIQPKDVVFVLDTSGSMAGEKMEQAKEALRYSLNRLGPRDRFGLVAFSSDVDAFRDALAPPTSREDALYFVDQLEARGGTNINNALLAAMEMLDGSENGTVIFLTDGLPSTGITDEGQIRTNVQQANNKVKLFAFGVGYDVNTRLLDGLAREAGAFADYISPEENIEERVGSFYEKVRYPVMTNLTLDLDGVDAFALAPGALPDLYKGSQLIVAGRYRRPGAATLRLRGQVEGETATRRYTFRFPERERERDFVARLWATRRVGQLLDAVRMQGENAELKEEIVALAKEFGLVTPYTSYLVREEEEFADQRIRQQQFNMDASADLDAITASPPAAEALQQTSGAGAVRASKAIREMQEAETVEAAPAERDVANVQGRLMLRTRESAWIDSEFDGEKDEAVQIKFASDAYFAFLRLYPEAMDFAKLGEAVTFRFGDVFVEIGEAGKTDMTETELRALFE